MSRALIPSPWPQEVPTQRRTRGRDTAYSSAGGARVCTADASEMLAAMAATTLPLAALYCTHVHRRGCWAARCPMTGGPAPVPHPS